MLTERTVSVANACWAARLNCLPEELFAKPFRTVTHGPGLADYFGVFALFRGAGATASIPPERDDVLLELLSSLSGGCSPESLASVLSSVSSAVIGPAYIGYAEAVSRPAHPARALELEDTAAVDALQRSCDATDWANGGSPIGHSCSGVFVGTRLVALAGYEVWDGTIAHIAIVTDPQFRSHRFGRSAVAHVAERAITAGLIPQYRTLQSNLHSMRIAESLGFQPYATSIAVRLNQNAWSSEP